MSETKNGDQLNNDIDGGATVGRRGAEPNHECVAPDLKTAPGAVTSNKAGIKRGLSPTRTKFLAPLNDMLSCDTLEDATRYNSVSLEDNSLLTVFKGSLEDAREAAFRASDISERRPVLLYIKNGKYSVGEDLCGNALCSQAVIDYLNANYVVWFCDMESESNKSELLEVWGNMFSSVFYHDFPDQKYPLLVGVMRSFERNTDGIATPQYEFRILLNVDILMGTRLKLDVDNLLIELNHFKKTCHEIEKNPLFSFVEKSGLPWEIIIAITQYLSFNDALSAFSNEILPLLDHPEAKFHLSDPAPSFIKKIVPTITHGKIVSLAFSGHWWSQDRLHFLPHSEELISITFHGVKSISLRDYHLTFLPKWTRLCLHYDREVNYKTLENILYEFQYQLKRFELHCPGLYVDYGPYDEPKDLQKKMIMVEYFLLNISLHSSAPMYGMNDSYQTRYFAAEMKLMRTMPNLRYLHLIIEKNDIERTCYLTAWEMIAFVFPKLEKIRIDVRDNTLENRGRLLQRALELQTAISRLRNSFKFQIQIF